MDNGAAIVKKFLLIVTIFFLASNAVADVNKGKRYYMKNFKQKFKMNGLDFVQLHTQAEWRALFEDEGKGFIIEFSKKYPKREKFLKNPKTWQKLQHVGDFAIEYASDSGKIPSCGNAQPAEAPIDLEVKDSSSAGFF